MFSLSNVVPYGSLRELSETVRRMFASAQAQVQTTWNAQHDQHGQHTDVTAQLLSAPRHRHSGLYIAPLVDAAASSYRTTGGGPLRSPIFNEVVVPHDVGVILFEPDDSASVDPAVGGGGYDVGSLILPRAAQTGDVIFVGKSSRAGYPVNLRRLYTTGRVNYQFYMDLTIVNPDAASAESVAVFTFDGPGLLPLVYVEAPYAFDATVSTYGGWMLPMTVSARTTPL